MKGLDYPQSEAIPFGPSTRGTGTGERVGALIVFPTLQAAWSAFLAQFEWQWFATFTFRDPPHPEGADKKWRVWVNLLNRSLYGRHWSRSPGRGVYWVRALERTKADVLHYHALLGDAEDLNARARRLTWMDEWNRLAGYAKIEVPRGSQFVASYVSKYVTKGGEIDCSESLKSYAEQISAVPVARNSRKREFPK